MKRKNIFIGLFLCIIGLFALTGCKSDDSNKYEGKASVTFVLNGGEFKNSNKDVTYYYDLEEGQECKIKTPTELSPSNDITNGKMVLKGWYKDSALTQIWDFEKETLSAKDSVKLYAKWGYNAEYKFAIYYKDEQNKDQMVTEISANSSTFKLNLDSGDVRGIETTLSKADYTSVWSFKDENGNAIKTEADGSGYKVDITNPGGEESVTVKVYLDVIKGKWKIVKTYNDLRNLGTSNIYIAGDIDCGGKELRFGDFKDRIFEGNNHKISNFKIGYSITNSNLVGDNFDMANTLKSTGYLSLFRTITNSEIRNVTFENANYDVQVSNSKVKTFVVAPLVYMASEAKITNVTMSVTGKISSTVQCEIIAADENSAGIGKADDKTVITGSAFEFKTN